MLRASNIPLRAQIGAYPLAEADYALQLPDRMPGYWARLRLSQQRGYGATQEIATRRREPGARTVSYRVRRDKGYRRALNFLFK
jgi:hypothetical protein